MDRELAGLDDPDPAVRADHDLLTHNEVGRRALDADLAGRDALRPELAAAAEEPAGPAHENLRPVERRHAHVSAELDVDLAGFDGASEPPATGEMELL